MSDQSGHSGSHSVICLFTFFFFNDTATTEIYTLSLHDALPISRSVRHRAADRPGRKGDEGAAVLHGPAEAVSRDRKSTRLNSSHPSISYAVFCLKKKKNLKKTTNHNKKQIS